MGVTADHGMSHEVHECDDEHERDGNRALAPAPPGRHHVQPVPPGEAELVMREPGECAGARHAACACPATSARKVSSRLVPLLPTCRRSSSTVPCAISRPPAML